MVRRTQLQALLKACCWGMTISTLHMMVEVNQLILIFTDHYSSNLLEKMAGKELCEEA